jgi:hypothetical protein
MGATHLFGCRRDPLPSHGRLDPWRRRSLMRVILPGGGGSAGTSSSAYGGFRRWSGCCSRHGQARVAVMRGVCVERSPVRVSRLDDGVGVRDASCLWPAAPTWPLAEFGYQFLGGCGIRVFRQLSWCVWVLGRMLCGGYGRQCGGRDTPHSCPWRVAGGFSRSACACAVGNDCWSPCGRRTEVCARAATWRAVLPRRGGRVCIGVCWLGDLSSPS